MTDPSSLGFVERVRNEADAESRAVVAELLALVPAELRARAEQVARILAALDLGVPTELGIFLDGDQSGVTVRPPVAPVTAPPAPVDTAPPAPTPEPEPPAPPEPTDAELSLAILSAAPHLEPRLRAVSVGAAVGIRPSHAKRLLENLAVRENKVVKHGDGAEAYYTLPGIDAALALDDRKPDDDGAAKPAATPDAERAPHAKDDTTSDDVPEELRKYPAAKRGGPLPQRIETARLNQRVHEYVLAAGGPVNAPETAKALDVSSLTATRHLGDLAIAGFLALAGDTRANAPLFIVGDGTPMPTEWPPDLGDMPAGQGECDTTSITIAMQQQAIVAAAEQLGKPFVIAEFEPLVPYPKSRTKSYLDMLADQGKYIKRTGKMRRAKGQDKGRTAVEYKAVRSGDRGASAKAGEKKAGATATEAADAPASGGLTRQQLLNSVRIAMQKRSGTDFASTDIRDDVNKAHNANVSTQTITGILDLLVEQGGGEGLRSTNDGMLRRYHYDRPDDPGPAARMDQRRRATSPDRGTSAPVAHTGRGPRSSHPDVQALLDAARKIVGPQNITSSGGHWAISCPNGARVLISSTPSNPRSVATDRARLRRIGELAV